MFTDLLAASDKKPAGGDPQGTPISVRIRERVQAAGRSFNANDNIADFIEPGEMDLLLDEVEAKMQGVLDSMVIDTANDRACRCAGLNAGYTSK
jgi:GTP cyclohydrolase I